MLSRATATDVVWRLLGWLPLTSAPCASLATENTCFPAIDTIGRDDCAVTAGYRPAATPRTIDWIVPTSNLFRLGAAHAEHSALVFYYGLL